MYINSFGLIVFWLFHKSDALSSCGNGETIPLGLETKRVVFKEDTKIIEDHDCNWRFLADNISKPILYKFENLYVRCNDTVAATTNESTKPYCGLGDVHPSTETPAGELSVKLRTNKEIPRPETHFTLYLIAAKGNETCPQQNITVTHEKQQITSPRFPRQYAANLQCRYILTAPSGVVLTFEYIDVEEHNDCAPNSCCDEIIIYEGLAIENRKLDSFCGLDTFEPNLKYESNGTTLTLELQTDDQGPKRGFVATVQARKTSLPYVSPTTTHTPSTPDVQDVTNTLEPCAAKCQGMKLCYVEHNCTHYEHCHPSNGAECSCTLMNCPFGTFWNAKINTCDQVAQVDCKSDPCLSLKSGSTYASQFNCRTYYKCDMNKSQPFCCDEGLAYDNHITKCTTNPNCSLECIEREGTQASVAPVVTPTFPELCYLRPVNGRPSEYLNEVSSVVQKCPIGTIFKAELCVCGQDPSFSKQECNPLVNVDFKGDHIINLSPQIYIQINNVKAISFDTDVKYGFFNGQSSSIQVPRLDSVALPRLQIQLRFKASRPTSGSASKYQVLVSNCHSKAKPWNISEVAQDLSPSLAIIANTIDQQLIFLLYSDDLNEKPVMFFLPYEEDVSNSVELVFNGTNLIGRVFSETRDNKAFRQFSGRIAASSGPLMVGMCSNKDAFHGYIDQVKIYDCIKMSVLHHHEFL